MKHKQQYCHNEYILKCSILLNMSKPSHCNLLSEHIVAEISSLVRPIYELPTFKFLYASTVLFWRPLELRHLLILQENDGIKFLIRSFGSEVFLANLFEEILLN